MAKKQGNLNLPKFRINDEIYGNYDVRITGEGIESRVLPLKEAKAVAESMELDLIEINPSTQPPIMKIASYEKLMYEIKKNAKKNKNTACLIIEKEAENKKEKCAAQSVTINSRID